jgi:hypothetical protein
MEISIGVFVGWSILVWFFGVYSHRTLARRLAGKTVSYKENEENVKRRKRLACMVHRLRGEVADQSDLLRRLQEEKAEWQEEKAVWLKLALDACGPETVPSPPPELVMRNLEL